MKTAQLLESGQSPGLNAGSRLLLERQVKQCQSLPQHQKRCVSCEASSPGTGRSVGPSMFVMKSNMWGKTDRPQPGLRMSVQLVLFIAATLEQAPYFWLVSPQLSSWFQIRN